MKYRILIVTVSGLLFLSGCSAFKAGGEAVGFIGKVTFETVKITGKVLIGGAKVLGTVVAYPFGSRVVKLTKEGDRLFVDVLLNRKVKAKMLLDTGCTQTLISKKIAKKLNLHTQKGRRIFCKVAGGYTVSGKTVILKEMRAARVRAMDVKTVVLDYDRDSSYDGLLGMSFLNNFAFRIDAGKGILILGKRKK